MSRAARALTIRALSAAAKATHGRRVAQVRSSRRVKVEARYRVELPSGGGGGGDTGGGVAALVGSVRRVLLLLSAVVARGLVLKCIRGRGRARAREGRELALEALALAVAVALAAARLLTLATHHALRGTHSFLLLAAAAAWGSARVAKGAGGVGRGGRGGERREDGEAWGGLFRAVFCLDLFEEGSQQSPHFDFRRSGSRLHTTLPQTGASVLRSYSLNPFFGLGFLSPRLLGGCV